MKKYLSLALCLFMLMSMCSVFAVTSSAAGPMIVWNFDVPNVSKEVVKNPDLLMPVYASRFQVGDGGGEGHILFDEKEKSLYLTPDFTKPGTGNLYFQRATFTVLDDAMGFAGADYPYVKVKMKLVTENDLTRVFLRDFAWGSFDLVPIPEVNTWVEYTADFSGTAWEDKTFNSSNGL